MHNIHKLLRKLGLFSGLRILSFFRKNDLSHKKS
jgi:hypothetical protein